MQENYEQSTEEQSQISEDNKPFFKTLKGVSVIIFAIIIFIITVLFLVGKEEVPITSVTPALTTEEKEAFRQRVEEANVPALTTEEKEAFRQRVEEANVPALTEEEKAAFRDRVGI